ncbi:MAG: hypothetical protein QM756_34240 [Polyangiaceae bacterium]
MVNRPRSDSTVESVSTSRGEMSLWSPSQDLLVCRVRKHGEGKFSPPIIRAFNALTGARIHIFFDFEVMPTYDSELRVELTKHFAEQRARIHQLDVLIGSRLVAMGVEVARLALNFIRPHTKRATFQAELDRAIIQRKLTGFSSSSLLSA